MTLPRADLTMPAELSASTKVDGLVIREQIRELVATYAHLGDRGELDDMVQLFEPDATLDAFGTNYDGRERIRSFLGDIVAGRADVARRTFVRHHVSSVTIRVDGPMDASGASYWAVYSDDGFESSGRYRDTYRRSADGVWRFRSRKIRLDEPRTAGNAPGR